MTHGTLARSKHRSVVDAGADALERVLDRIAVADRKVPERLAVWVVGGLAGIAVAVALLLAVV